MEHKKRKKKKDEHIKFYNALRKCFNNKDSRIALEMGPSGLQCLNILLNELTHDLIVASTRMFDALPKAEGFNAEYIQRAVNKNFKKVLAQHAMSEGNKAVFKFANGLLKYHAKPPKTARRARKFKQKEGPDFAKGLKKILQSIHKHGSITAEASVLVCTMIESLLTYLVSKIKEKNVKSEKIDEVAIKEIVESILTSTMADHAHSEGMKSLVLYNSGMLTYKPEVEKIKKKKKLLMIRKKKPGELAKAVSEGKAKPVKKRKRVAKDAPKKGIKTVKRRKKSGRKRKASPEKKLGVRGKKRKVTSPRKGKVVKRKAPIKSKSLRPTKPPKPAKSKPAKPRPPPALFRAGIQSIFREIHERGIVTPAAMNLINQLLCHVLEVVKDKLSKSNKPITLTELNGALQEILPDEMRQHAISESTRALFVDMQDL